MLPMEAKPWGAELRDARVAEGDSQVEAADRLGISRSHLGNLELGRKLPSPRVAYRVARVYHVSPRLLTGEAAA